MSIKISPLFKAGQWPEIDGLRAMAILLVLLTHTFQTVPGLSYVRWNFELLKPLFNGWVGVDLFFVLSGFLVGGQIIRSIEENSFSYKNFYLRRTFRILPTYFVVLFICVLIAYIFPAIKTDGIVEPTFSILGKNLLLLTDYFPLANLGVPSWSISIEEKFYLLAPIVIVSLSKFKKNTLIKLLFSIFTIALIIRMLSYRIYELGSNAPLPLVMSKIYFPFHVRLDALVAGVCAYLTLQPVKTSESSEILSIIARRIGILLVVLVLMTGALMGGWFETTIQYSMLAIGFSMFLFGLQSASSASLTKNFLSLKIWIPIARLSYSIYLTHIFIIHAYVVFLKSYQDQVIFTTGLFFSCLLIPIPIFLLIEEPIHSWAKNKF